MTERILHIVLLFSVLLSSTGFVVGKHHCQRMEELKGSNLEVASCSEMGGCKKGCCTKTAQYFHLDQDQQLPQVDLNLPKCPISIAFEKKWVDDTDLENHRILHQLPCIPPIVEQDRLALLQVYLC